MVEMTTVNALGTGWVDNIPGDASTGFQAQNTASEAVRAGLDTVLVSYASSDFGSIRIKTGGTFDDSGVLFTVKDDVLLSVLNYTGSYYIIANKTNTTTRTLALLTEIDFSTKCSFVAAKNGWYHENGNRVLNSVITTTKDTGFVTIAEVPNDQVATVKGKYANTPNEVLAFNDYLRLSTLLGPPMVINSTMVDVLTADISYYDGKAYVLYNTKDSTNNVKFYTVDLSTGVAVSSSFKVGNLDYGSGSLGQTIAACAVGVYDSKLSIFVLKTNNYGVQPQPWYVEIYSMQSGSVGTKLATITNINPTETTMSIKIYNGVLYSNIATAIKKHVGFTAQVSTVYKLPTGLGGVWGFCFSASQSYVPVDIPEEVFVTKNALGGVKTFSGAFMRFRDDKGLVLMSGYEQPYKSCYGIDSVEGKYIISLDLVTKTLFIR
jgi:hypothetical protein